MFHTTITPDFTDAACRNHNTDIWFNPETKQQAITICNTCPIINTCHNYALTLPLDTEGIYAAQTQYELNRHRRQQPKTINIEHGTTAGYHKHLRYKIPTCEPCRAANAQYQHDRKHNPHNITPKPFNPKIVHGTRSGAEQHRKYGIPLCEPCEQAKIMYHQERHRNKKLRQADN